MLIKAENTMEKRKELNGYNIMVDCIDCHYIYAFRFEQEMTGTEKQIEYAKSLLANRVFKVNDTAGVMLSNKKMTPDEYYEGIEIVINKLSQLTDAKYIIEKF